VKTVEYKKLTNKSRREWVEWRNSVWKRDNFECQHCHTKEKLVAHHIIPTNEDESLIFEVSNGLTFCRSCHAKHHGKSLCNYKTFKGEKRSEEFKQKIRNTMIGIRHTKERKKRQSEAKLGKSWKLDKETGKRVWYKKDEDI
jgi:5-methylcytosine-specific restriction endonuclease McrA